MTRARTRVLAGAVGVALAAGLAAPALLAPATGAAQSSRTQVRRPALELTGNWVFSPNGDGRYDVARYTVALRKRAKVTIKVLDRDGDVVRGPVRLGEYRADSTVRWKWDGRDTGGHRVADGHYVVLAKAATYAGYVVTDEVRLEVDTVVGPHQLVSNFDTVYPRTRVVTDRIWFGTRGYYDASKGTLRIRTAGGKLVLRKIAYWIRDYPYKAPYPVAWNGRDADGHALPAGEYWARVVSTDRVGNRGRTPRIPVYVSATRLVQATGTVDVTPADSRIPYNPCRNSTANGCGDFPPCGTVVPSTSYPEAGALSYRSDTACSPDMSQLAVGWHELPRPVDSARGTSLVWLTMRGKPMNYGEPDVARISGGGTSATTAPTGQETSTTIDADPATTQTLVGGGNAFWAVTTTGTDAFDVASFRVTYSYLTRAP